MPDYRLREWILSLVTTPERARTIIGDMTEEGRGTLSSWAAIASQIVHAFTPGLIGMALAASLAQFLLPFLLAAVTMKFLRPPWDEQSFRTLHLWNLVAFAVTQIVTGYWIGPLGSPPLPTRMTQRA
jgi:hypothetical protein